MSVESTFSEQFLNKIAADKLIVGVIGLGYVGLPLSEAFSKVGVSVIGYDINESRVEQLNNGLSGMNHIDDKVVKDMLETGKFLATTDIGKMREADALLICVPTPLDKYHHPDLSYVRETCETLAAILRPGHLVVLESTTYPGTTDEVMKPILEKTGLKSGVDFAIAYSPEREDPGNIDFSTSSIPKLVGADSEAERVVANAVYSKIVETVMVNDTRTAEAAKLTENIFRWVNIAMVNELKLIYDEMGINVWDVIEAADTKPFGFMAFYPGPGVGGHCIRVDPYYLTWKAREHGISTQFIELAGQINIGMPKRVVARLMEELNRRQKKALSGTKILLCGMSYKRDVDDVRESPSFEVMKELLEHGAEVDYYDPHARKLPYTHDYPEFMGMESVDWDLNAFSKYTAAVITTNHSSVDYAALVDTIPLTLDSRNITKGLSAELLEKVALA